jgi:hypothetical protein
MHELPIAALLVRDVVRRQFEPDPPARPRPPRRHPVRAVRLATSAALHAAARAVAPPPECTTAH